jgi:hypothetical protein
MTLLPLTSSMRGDLILKVELFDFPVGDPIPHQTTGVQKSNRISPIAIGVEDLDM